MTHSLGKCMHIRLKPRTLIPCCVHCCLVFISIQFFSKRQYLILQFESILFVSNLFYLLDILFHTNLKLILDWFKKHVAYEMWQARNINSRSIALMKKDESSHFDFDLRAETNNLDFYLHLVYGHNYVWCSIISFRTTLHIVVIYLFMSTNNQQGHTWGKIHCLNLNKKISLSNIDNNFFNFVILDYLFHIS